MKPKTVKIGPAELQTLLASKIDGNTLTLPEQLGRAAYVAVNKVIELAGGKWDKKRKCHVFEKPVTEALGLALEAREIVDAKKTRQAYYTPAPVAASMAALVAEQMNRVQGNKHPLRVLEPSAGAGALAFAMVAAFRKSEVTCVEIDAACVEELRREIFEVIQADFLAMPAPVTEQGLFDAVIMNPPFTGDQDARHVLHAWNFLRPRGILVAIVSPRYQFARTRDSLALNDLVQFTCQHEEELPAGTFKESGTDVRTMLIALRKR